MDNISAKYVDPIIFNIKGWLDIIDIKELEKLFSDILLYSGFNVLNYSSHKFPHDAYTAFWLLAESHLAIHTFVENNTCYFELSSCNEEKTNIFMNMLSENEISVRWQSKEIKKSMAIVQNPSI